MGKRFFEKDGLSGYKISTAMSGQPAPTILDRILADVQEEVGESKRLRSLSDLRAMIADAPPVRSLPEALNNKFGLIAEVKAASPSVGAMRAENVAEAPDAYEESLIVRALSVLTNKRHFGGSMERMQEIRDRVSKPVLRKDFIVDEYQIREARAFGSDAILLMASVLDAARLKGFYELALELGMEAHGARLTVLPSRGVGLLVSEGKVWTEVREADKA